MNKSIVTELESHLRDKAESGILTLENKEDWHFHAFNEDYYIIYHSAAFRWLRSHDLDAFDAIAYVIEQQELHFGESLLAPDDVNPEHIVNLIVYFAGFEALSNIEDELVEQLEESE